MNNRQDVSRGLILIVFSFLLLNLLSVTVLNQSFGFVRYLRQPSLGFFLAGVFHFYQSNDRYESKLKIFRNLFLFFVFYLIFNVLTSLDQVNSLIYVIWLLGLLVFLYQLFIRRNPLPFRPTLRSFLIAATSLGTLVLAASYIGGYVLGISSFFDERFNYTIGTMKTEFSGVFGSNNSLGMSAFYTSAFFLLLSSLSDRRLAKWLLFGMAIFCSSLIFQIGNRASMICCLFFWFLYFVWVRQSIAGVIILATSLVVFGTLYQDELTEKLRLEQFDGGNILGNRSGLFSEAVEITENMDFFGVGFQNQRLSRKFFRLVSENDKEYNFHNSYLAVVAELGWFGLLWIPGFILYGLFFFNFGNTIPRESRIPIRLIQSLLLTICLIHLPVEDTINSPGSAFFLWFWGLFFIMILGKCQSEIEVHG